MEIEEKKWCVYIHRNKTNNKAYVGITSDTLSSRWKNGNGYVHNQHFSSAIKKYGWDGFEHFVWKDNLSEQDAKHIEILLIALFKTNCCKYYNPSYGYNMTDGGDGSPGRVVSEEQRNAQSERMKIRLSDPTNHPFYGKHFSDESKKKMSEARKGTHPSDETRKKLSEARIGSKNHNYGKSLSEETKKKISESKKGKYTGENNPNYGNHKLAGKNHPNYGKKISDEQKKKLSEYAKANYKGDKNPRAKPIVQLTLEGQFIREWSYITQASKELGISRSSLTKCINHKQHSACGFKWMTKEEYNKLM